MNNFLLEFFFTTYDFSLLFDPKRRGIIPTLVRFVLSIVAGDTMNKRSIWGALVLLALAGCTQSFFTGTRPQSNFDYPNSNVTPLGHVSGSASTSAFFGTPFVTSDLEQRAIQNAISKKPGADLLINYETFQDRSGFLFVHSLTYRVEGTAAKMEIGRQDLH
ncbi:MAG TPA: hypothetical protein VJ998_02995 [Pseudomonadales bacterium]|nr:hypothetical protein [Pseudomonadales bacterium]